MSGCDVWPGDAPCGKPEVERLRYLNLWMDSPGDGLPVCAEHLEEHVADHLLAPGTRRKRETR